MREGYAIFSMIFSIVAVASCAVTAMGPGGGVDKEFMVPSQDAELYLRVRGDDSTNPILLYLHGGPGEASGPLLFQAYVGPDLEKHFVVAYLHQRHTCMSPEAPLSTLTIRHYVDDVDTVVTFLKNEFEKDKILLLGHSFGGGLGYLYLLGHGENIEKFVSAGGAFSTMAIETNGYQTVTELSIDADNQDAFARLKEVGPPPYETPAGCISRGLLARSGRSGKNRLLYDLRSSPGNRD